MKTRRHIQAILVALLALAVLPAAASAAPKIDGEFSVPGLGANNKIVEGPDGNMWATVSNEAKDVARITPAGEVKEFELKEGLKEVTSASGIAVDAEGHLWITGTTPGGEGLVARFTPAAVEAENLAEIHEVAQVKVPFAPIVLGSDGRMWVATENLVFAFPPKSANPEGDKQEFVVGGLAPRDIDAAGQLLAVSDSERIVTLTTAGVEKDYALKGTSQGLAGNKAGLIAYSEPGATPQAVGFISPPNLLPEIETPKPGGDPFGVTVGSDGAFWFVMGAFGQVARLAPNATQLTFLEGMPKDGLERQIASGPKNTLWVTVTKAEHEAVARVTGLESGGKTGGDPDTRIDKRPKATVRTKAKRAVVKLSFSSPDAGASFACRLVRIAKGAKTPAFAACKSPKTYRLAAGRYRFEVRAALGGAVDKSPATAAFRVVHVARHRHH